MYYIYHIPGKKIGCTTNPKRRIEQNQRYKEYQILETHTDINIASQREIELQKQYGYEVDRKPYYKTIKMCSKGGISAKLVNAQSKAGKLGGKKNKESGHISYIGKIFGKIQGIKNVQSGHLESIRTFESCSKGGKIGGKLTGKYVGDMQAKSKSTCPHCGKIGQTRVMGRWHFDNCKHKNVK